MAYSLEELGEGVEKLGHKVEKLLEHESTEEKEGTEMGDIAGLMALMQGNKGMDLPGLLALCKDKGVDQGFGGQGMFLFVFLILFLFAGGGFGNLSKGNQAAFTEMAGNNCQSIIGIHDRISAAQAASTEGFFALDTKLCSSIAEVIASVRNQGDRNYDATRNVGDAVRDCCCRMEASMATILCEIKGVGRDIRDMGGLITAKIELEALKGENARQAMECRIVQGQKDCCCEMNQQFERLNNKIDNQCKDQEIARLRERLNHADARELAQTTAQAAVQAVEGFVIQHYTPTRTASSASGSVVKS